MNEQTLTDEFDYIVSHFDGNNNDPNDIAALLIAATLADAAGFEDKSVFFYNNNADIFSTTDELVKFSTLEKKYK